MASTSSKATLCGLEDELLAGSSHWDSFMSSRTWAYCRFSFWRHSGDQESAMLCWKQAKYCYSNTNQNTPSILKTLSLFLFFFLCLCLLFCPHFPPTPHSLCFCCFVCWDSLPKWTKLIWNDVSQSVFKFSTLLPLYLGYLDYRHAPQYLASDLHFLIF